MATKLKNISRNRLTKLTAFALSILMVWLAVNDMGDFLYENKHKDISLMAESLFADSYFETARVASMIRNGTHFVLTTASKNGAEELPEDLSPLEYIVLNDTRTVMTSDHGKRFDHFRDGNYIVFENYTISEVGGEIPSSMLDSFYFDLFDGNGRAIIVFPDEYWGDGFEEFDEYRDSARNLVGHELTLFAIFLLCVVYLITVSGRRPQDNDVHLIFPDTVWTEVHLGGIFLLIMATFFVLVNLSYSFSPYVIASTYNFAKIIISLSVCAVYSLFMWLLLSLVRKAKSKMLLRSTCIGWCWHKIKAFFKAVATFFREFVNNFTSVQFKDTHFAAAFHKIQVRFVVISIAMFALFFFSVFFIFVTWDARWFWILMTIGSLTLEGVIIWQYIKKTTQYAQSMARLLIQIDRVSSGELDYYAGIEEGDPLAESSDKLANIGEGLNEALVKQMKDERMKIELITNVSHDLKTPLTSIISYIDLLKKEEMGEVARDYVGILAQKADRLKGIVSDLFDLAKTNSGNIELDMKPLDFTKLTNQLLGDMEDKITASGMKLKINLAPSPVVIRADGLKLSRALQNVLDNALKYSLPGSRIYIDLVKGEANAVLSVKNTSAFEMDFTADEIMQRFVRGDKNRSTDGSGLGLSIAQSFTEVSGGKFGVSIDGDQFKTVFTFPVCRDEITKEGEEII